jgi:hypothetical protein
MALREASPFIHTQRLSGMSSLFGRLPNAGTAVMRPAI